MSNKNWLPLLVLLVLAIVYVVYFTDWLHARHIQIRYASRPTGRTPRHNASPDTAPATFGLDGPYGLTEVKVVPLAEWQTNKNSLPVWHLISDSNSVPLKTFSYGQNIRGMKPALPGARPEPLEPDVTYHLILQAGRIKGERDFLAKPNDTGDSPTP